MKKARLTKTALRKRCEELGATLDWSETGIHVEACIEAPPGHVWTGIGIHELVIHGHRGFRGSTAEIVKSALEDMEAGTEPCTDPDCEWCADTNERETK